MLKQDILSIIFPSWLLFIYIQTINLYTLMKSLLFDTLCSSQILEWASWPF